MKPTAALDRPRGHRAEGVPGQSPSELGPQSDHPRGTEAHPMETGVPKGLQLRLPRVDVERSGHPLSCRRTYLI